MNIIRHRLRNILAHLSLLLLSGPLAGQAHADPLPDLVISNWTMTDYEITFDISGTIDAAADIGPSNSHWLIIGVTGDTDWVLGTFALGSVTNHAGATRDLTAQAGSVGGGIHSNYVRLETTDGLAFVPGDVIDASVEVYQHPSNPPVLVPANLVKEDLIVSAGYTFGGGTASVPQAAHQVGAYEMPPSPPAVVPPSAAPDTARPTVKFLKKKKLKKPRRRHKIKGLARDNAAVARVEVRVKSKGWRKAKLRASGRWKFKTPRLESGRKNKFKVRAEDASGNRSRAKKVKAMGL